MLYSRWLPVLDQEFNRLQHQMNRLFHRYGEPEATARGFSLAYPAINVWEDNDNVYAEAELPGVNADHLQIHVNEGNRLTLQGERQPGETSGVWHRQERGYGKFQREVLLPVQVEAGKVEARLGQGVLSLTLPKSEAAKPRKITVKAE
jgi:HSP20 family protein